MSEAVARWQHAHDVAQANGRNAYVDPATGYLVFTEVGLLSRGRCCGSGCRHCPWGHLAVRGPPRERLGGGPTWRVLQGGHSPGCDVLFWSGGKDAYLSLLHLREEGARRVVLLTTHEEATGRIPHQEIPVDRVVAQARALGLDLITAPLAPDADYVGVVEGTLDAIHRRFPVRRLVFGDLHVAEIRAWREEQLGPWAADHEAELVFPLWHAPYPALRDRLERSGARIELSAVPAGYGRVGQLWDARFLSSLPPTVDPFGENGEFHTWVTPPG